MINAVMIVVVLFDMTGPYSHRCLREPLRAAVQCADRTSHYGAVTTANQTPTLVRMRRQYVTLRRRNYSQSNNFIGAHAQTVPSISKSLLLLFDKAATCLRLSILRSKPK